jgi:hypothetical protein
VSYPDGGFDKRQRRVLGPPTLAFTIQEFCDAHRISRSQYYALKQMRLGPVETDVAGKIIITIESAAAWRRKRTSASQRRSHAGKATAETTATAV